MQFLPVAMAVFQGVSSIAKGNSQAKQYEAYARQQDYNAAVMRQRAATTSQVYGTREGQMRTRQRVMLGRQSALAAESGAGLGGSAADLERQSEIQSELDILNLRYEGDLTARGLLQDADVATQDAAYSRSNKRGAKIGGYLGAASAALSGYGGYIKGGGGARPNEQPSDRLIMDFNGYYPYG